MAELLRVERDLWGSGVRTIAGVDEVGVGPLAGPVVAAAVVVPQEIAIAGIDDSKRVSAARREDLAARLREAALGVAVGVVAVEDVDRLNVYHAALEAMRRAVAALPVPPEHVVVDARRIPGLRVPQTPLIGGDGRSYSIAAASIVAKVERDAIMRRFDDLYPQYGFGTHMGYPTAAHIEALRHYGPCPIHRRSFAPVRQLLLPGL